MEKYKSIVKESDRITSGSIPFLFTVWKLTQPSLLPSYHTYSLHNYT